ncbi:MAG: LuxR C-terminal-related transcriptional regulator [Acidimicrobiia bacterium]
MAWPFVGRDRAVAELAGTLRQGRGVVVAGPAGVGKTRLVGALVEHLEGADGLAVRWFAGSETARTQPLGAFYELVGGRDDDPRRALAACTARLDASLGDRPALVVVDDAHHLDPLSAMLVDRWASAGRLRLVLTVRAGDPCPDLVAATWKDHRLARADLGPLDEDETAALVRAVVERREPPHGIVGAAAVRRLWSLTQGNPLYLRHLLDAEPPHQPLVLTAGVWRWAPEATLSPGLVELIERRMAGLDPSVLDLVDRVALAEPLPVEVAVATATPDAVERAEAAGLVRPEPGADRLVLRPGHALYGEVRRAQMGELRARRLRAQVYEALRARPGLADVVVLASLLVDSDAPGDADLLTAAADAAMLRLDLHLAVSFAEAAIAAGGGFDARVVRAYALSWLSRGEESQQEVEAVLAGELTDRQAWQAAAVSCGNQLFDLGRVEGALAALDQVAPRLEGTPHQADVLAFRSWVEAFRGHHRDAVEHARVALASSTSDPRAATFAAIGAVTALGSQGRVDELRPIAEAGLAASHGSFQAAILRYALAEVELWALRLAGLGAEAQRIADGFAAELDLPAHFTAFSRALVGYSALTSGELGVAVGALHEARVGLEGERTGWRPNVLANLAVAHAARGEPEDAARALAEAEAVVHPAFAFRRPELDLARAWVHAAEGARADAVALACRAAARAEEATLDAVTVLALHVAVRFGDSSCAPRLAELAASTGTPRAVLAAEQAVALAEGDGTGLQEVAVRFEELGDLAEAVDAHAQAHQAHRRAGRQGSANLAALRVEALSRACGGLATPAVEAVRWDVPLTDREREVVHLVAGGMSNRAVATRLEVSVRTVENHLYRAGTKLGVSGREALRGLFSLTSTGADRDEVP